MKKEPEMPKAAKEAWQKAMGDLNKRQAEMREGLIQQMHSKADEMMWLFADGMPKLIDYLKPGSWLWRMKLRAAIVGCVVLRFSFVAFFGVLWKFSFAPTPKVVRSLDDFGKVIASAKCELARAELHFQLKRTLPLLKASIKNEPRNDL